MQIKLITFLYLPQNCHRVTLAQADTPDLLNPNLHFFEYPSIAFEVN